MASCMFCGLAWRIYLLFVEKGKLTCQSHMSQSHYAVQCEALDGTPLPAPLCKLLRLPQGTKWGRHEAATPAPAPAPAPVQAREEEC